MSYPIRKSDGTLIIDLQPGVTDTSKTSLALIGKNSADFGLNQNQNFVKLLENFANAASPTNVVTGQLWFDTAAQQLNIYTSSGYKALGPFAALQTPSVSNISDTPATTAFVHSIIPKGIILMWSGTLNTIPTGWALCNGQQVNGLTTPDLTKKFVMGAGTSVGASLIPGYSSYAPGTQGGNSTINTTPAHSHSFSVTSENNNREHTHSGYANTVGDHHHVYPGDDQLSNARNYAGWSGVSQAGFPYDARSVLGGGGQLWQTTDAGGHTHVLTINPSDAGQDHQHTVSGNTNATGAISVDVTNPFYALAFIIKTI